MIKCEACGGNVKVNEGRSLSRHYVNLDQLRIANLEAALLKADEALVSLYEEQLEIDRANGKWLLKARETRAEIKELISEIRGRDE